jgi:hypothetical protein
MCLHNYINSNLKTEIWHQRCVKFNISHRNIRPKKEIFKISELKLHVKNILTCILQIIQYCQYVIKW